MAAAEPDPAALVSGGRVDPARLLPLQRRYRQRLDRAYREVRGHTTTTLGQHDALGLATQRHVDGPVRRFDGATPAERRDAFATWLRHNLDRAVLDGVHHGAFVRAAYAKGVLHADAVLRATGAARPDPDTTAADVLAEPVHRRAAETLAARTTNDLDAVNSAVVTDATEQVAGAGAPASAATAVADRVDKVGIHRGRLVARYRTQEAVATGSLRRYRQHGTGEVTALVEEQVAFGTAGDDRVCPECADLEGVVFTLSAAAGVLPRHPFCRCVWIFTDAEPDVTA